MIKRIHRRKNGFTLVEILIVIAIIGIIAAIAFPQFNIHKFKSFIGMTRTDAKNVHTAIVSWIADNPGAGIPEVPSFSGPGVLPSFGVAVISKGVTVSISNAGDITATHESLGGSYKFFLSGGIGEDSLVAP